MIYRLMINDANLSHQVWALNKRSFFLEIVLIFLILYI